MIESDPIHDLIVPEECVVEPVDVRWHVNGPEHSMVRLDKLRQDPLFETFFQKVNYQCSIDGSRRAICRMADGELLSLSAPRDGLDQRWSLVQPLLDRLNGKLLHFI